MKSEPLNKIQYAKAWKRLVAQIIDGAFVFIFSIALFMIFRFPPSLFKWTLFWVFFTYSIFSDAYRQGTPGKHIMQIRVVKNSDIRSNLQTAFYRNLIKAILGIFLFDFFWIMIVPGRQGFHNQLAKSIVVENSSQNATAANIV